MSDYLPPDGMTVDGAGQALFALPLIADGEQHEVDRTYFDTFDGLLRADGLSFVYEGGRVELVERASGRVVAGMAASQPIAPVLADDLPGALREALEPVAGVRALLPLVHVHSRVRALRVLDEELKTVVRMTVEEPAVVGRGTAPAPLRPRVRLAAVRGYDGELEDVERRLEQDLGFRAADQPLVDEAVRAAGLPPAGVSARIDVRLGFNEPAGRAAARVLRRLLEVIETTLDGTIADLDTEFLHDLRVAVRRTRAVQRELRAIFPAEALAHFRAEFRWLQQMTGPGRDLDVYVLEFEHYRAMVPPPFAGDLGPLLTVLRARRAAAREEMVRALQGERFRALVAGWSEFIAASAIDARPEALEPIGPLAGERITRVYRRMVKMGRAIGGESSAEDYHELRKKGKELRYLLELFGAPLHPSGVVKPMIKALKSLQDVLGNHQDREVQVAMLRTLVDDVAALPRGPAALLAMGVLVERLREDEQAARGEFSQRFSAFASKDQRRLVRETFV